MSKFKRKTNRRKRVRRFDERVVNGTGGPDVFAIFKYRARLKSLERGEPIPVTKTVKTFHNSPEAVVEEEQQKQKFLYMRIQQTEDERILLFFKEEIFFFIKEIKRQDGRISRFKSINYSSKKRAMSALVHDSVAWIEHVFADELVDPSSPPPTSSS